MENQGAHSELFRSASSGAEKIFGGPPESCAVISRAQRSRWE